MSVAAGAFTDAAGNPNAVGASDTVDVDAVDPTITVDIVATALNEDGTSAVTFTFSEAVGAGSFTLDDIDAEGGTVTGLTQTANALVWTATFAPAPDFDGTASVSVAAGAFTDAAGNFERGGRQRHG